MYAKCSPIKLQIDSRCSVGDTVLVGVSCHRPDWHTGRQTVCPWHFCTSVCRRLRQISAAATPSLRWNNRYRRTGHFTEVKNRFPLGCGWISLRGDQHSGVERTLKQVYGFENWTILTTNIWSYGPLGVAYLRTYFGLFKIAINKL